MAKVKLKLKAFIGEEEVNIMSVNDLAKKCGRSVSRTANVMAKELTWGVIMETPESAGLKVVVDDEATAKFIKRMKRLDKAREV